MALIGNTAPTGASGSTTTSALPDWYMNTAKQIIANQQAVSNTPYTTYQGPRVAAFSPTTQAGFDQTKTAATAYKPGLDYATSLTKEQAGRSMLGEAQPYFTEANKASTANIGEYMNPYTDSVVNRIGDVGARTLFEKILPGISDRMIGAGGFGGTRQAELTGRGIREAMEGITAEQANALSSGYSEALGASATDLARRAGLGTSAADIYGRDTTNALTVADKMADYAGKAQDYGLTGAAATRGVGAAEEAKTKENYDVAYADFLRSQGYPQEQIDQQLKTLTAAKAMIPTGEISESYAPLGGSSGTSGTKTSGLQDAATTVATLGKIKELLGIG